MYKLIAFGLLVVGLFVFKWLYDLPINEHTAFTLSIPLLMVGSVGLWVFYLYRGQYLGIDKRFIRSIKDHWYSGRWYMYGDRNTLLSKDPTKCAFSPIFLKGKYFNGLVPAMCIDGMVGLYCITRDRYRGEWSKGGSDRCLWDDGLSVDLRLVKVISLQGYRAEISKIDGVTNGN